MPRNVAILSMCCITRWCSETVSVSRESEISKFKDTLKEIRVRSIVFRVIPRDDFITQLHKKIIPFLCLFAFVLNFFLLRKEKRISQSDEKYDRNFLSIPSFYVYSLIPWQLQLYLLVWLENSKLLPEVQGKKLKVKTAEKFPWLFFRHI